MIDKKREKGREGGSSGLNGKIQTYAMTKKKERALERCLDNHHLHLLF